MSDGAHLRMFFLKPVWGFNREAVMQLSPGLTRFASTLGIWVWRSNPNGVVAVSHLNEFGKIRPTLPLAMVNFGKRRNPVGVASVSITKSHGRREARQPWAELPNRFTVVTLEEL